jgi:hypothetical protein
MLDNLRKKKMLAELKNKYAKDFSEEAKSQGYKKPNRLTNQVMNADNGEKSPLSELPSYQALKSIPIKDQLKMMEDHSQEIKDDPSHEIEESEDEKKRRMLENLFLSKGQRNS